MNNVKIKFRIITMTFFKCSQFLHYNSCCRLFNRLLFRKYTASVMFFWQKQKTDWQHDNTGYTSLTVLQLGLCFSGEVEMGHDHTSDLTFRHVGLPPLGSVYWFIWHSCWQNLQWRNLSHFFQNGTRIFSLSFPKMF